MGWQRVGLGAVAGLEQPSGEVGMMLQQGEVGKKGCYVPNLKDVARRLPRPWACRYHKGTFGIGGGG